MAPETEPSSHPPLEYAPRPSPPRHRTNPLWWWWALSTFVAVPAGILGLYQVQLGFGQSPKFVYENRHGLAACSIGLICVGALTSWWLYRAILRGQRRLEQTTADAISNADSLLICKNCGPFPRELLLVTPPGRVSILAWRLLGLVFLAAGGMTIYIVLGDRLPGNLCIVGGFLILLGFGMWRTSRAAAERCPNCRSKSIADGRTAVGKQQLRIWHIGDGSIGQG